MGEYYASGADKLNRMVGICDKVTSDSVVIVLDFIMLFLGLVINLPLAWLFFKERKDLSPSKVLGVNLVLMQLLYIITAPVGLAIRLVYEVEENDTLGNDTSGTELIWTRMVDDGTFIMLLTGFPLLLACMCVERFIAVARPLLYLRARKWEYKMAISAAIWVVTLIFVVVTVLLQFQNVTVPIFVLTSVLFLVMISCLVGLAWSLRQQSPAHSTAPPLTLKRRALRNVLMVIVPAMVSYLPIFLLIPVATHGKGDKMWCTLLQAILFCPLFGICIGPMFYRAKIRRVLCGRKGGRGRPSPAP